MNSRIYLLRIAAILFAVLMLGLSIAGAQTPIGNKSGRGSIGANGPKPGSAAPDFSLQSVDGKTIKASDLWRQKPAVIMTGSHTCPIFRNKVQAFESLAKEFADRVNFLVVYTVEAHPKGDPSPYSGKEWTTPANEKIGLLIRQPKTMEERIKRAQMCMQSEKLTVPVVVDTMENIVWKSYGSAPNCAYVIGKDGKIIAAEPWMEPSQLRKAITSALGGGKN